jgi:uncharacterized protein
MPIKDVSLLRLPAEQERRRAVMLTTTQDCNLRCRYCYEPTKTRRYMSLEVAQWAITEYMEADDEFEAVEFDFFGGEPMLAFDLIRDVVEWFHSREWSKRHLFYIGTNGTILTEEMKDWLVKYGECMKVGVSLDGNKIAHDLSRDNSYDRLMRNLPFFLEHWPDQPAKTTICAETIPYVADSIIDLEEKGILFIANLVFEDIWGSMEQKVALLETYAQQLDRLVEYYAVHPHLFPASIVDRQPEYGYQSSVSRPVGGDCERWCGAGHEMIMVDMDGRRYSCHRFSPFVTGRPAPIEVANRQTTWRPEKCAKCRFVVICPTCVGFNWQENGDSGIRTTYHCDAFKLEVQASAKLQALRLLQQQPEDFTKLPLEEAYRIKCRLDSILDLAANGV